MPTLLVVVEGHTEVEVVRSLLGPRLVESGFHRVEPRLLGNTRRKQGGGIRSWPAAKKEIMNHLKGGSWDFVTTMVDFYAMPATKDRAWPGRAEARKKNGAQHKGECVQAAMAADIAGAMGSRFNPARFLPFVTMHEFEGLLFSDCEAIGRAEPGSDVAKLMRVRNAFASPEDINDSPNTAPSKRLAPLVPGYDKTYHGPLVALQIGLDRIRAECAHFNAWLSKLEALAANRG